MRTPLRSDSYRTRWVVESPSPSWFCSSSPSSCSEEEEVLRFSFADVLISSLVSLVPLALRPSPESMREAIGERRLLSLLSVVAVPPPSFKVKPPKLKNPPPRNSEEDCGESEEEEPTPPSLPTDSNISSLALLFSISSNISS